MHSLFSSSIELSRLFFPLLQLRKATEWRFVSRRQFRWLPLASGGCSGAGCGGKRWNRWPVYIPTFIRLGFYEQGFGSSESGSRVRSSCLYLSSAAVAAASVWSPVTVTSNEDLQPAVKMGYVFYQFLIFDSDVMCGGCLGRRKLVFLSLQSGLGVEVCFVRLVYSYHGSGWSSSLLAASGLPATLEAPDLRSLGKRLLVWAFSDYSAHRCFRCTICCQGWVLEKLCDFFGSAFVELELGFRAQVQRRFLLGMRRWAAAPATSSEGVKAAGFVLQGSGCNFYFMWSVLVSNDCNLLYQ